MDFDLDIPRTLPERVEMVLHPDCPRDNVFIAATYDTEVDVILACLSAVTCDDEIREIVLDRVKDEPGIDEKLKAIALAKFGKTYCPIPWTHASTTAIGTVRACCQMIYNDESSQFGLIKKANGKPLTSDDSITRNRNLPLWKELRSSMLKGEKHQACKLCWDEEDAGTTSKRQWSDKIFPKMKELAFDKTKEDGTISNKQFPLQWWDLRFGNKCNLKCRTCNPSNSSLWYDDHMALEGTSKTTINMDGRDFDIVEKNGRYDIPAMKEWYEDSRLWNDLIDNLDSVKRLYFTGGEPTVNDKHMELLEHIVEKGFAKDITLEYNSNIAASPEKFIDLWKEFKMVTIGISMDGIFEHFEYIRNPAKWKRAMRTIELLDTDIRLTNLKANFTVTVSVMNLFHLPDMITWIREQNFKRIMDDIHVHLVHYPEIYSICNLPTEMKEQATSLFEHYINWIHKRWPTSTCNTHFERWAITTERVLRSVLTQMNETEGDVAQWSKFLETTEKLDKLRNEDWRVSLPSLYKATEKMELINERAQRTALTDLGKKKRAKEEDKSKVLSWSKVPVSK